MLKLFTAKQARKSFKQGHTCLEGYDRVMHIINAFIIRESSANCGISIPYVSYMGCMATDSCLRQRVINTLKQAGYKCTDDVSGINIEW